MSKDLKDFEEALVIARKYNVKKFVINQEEMHVELGDDPIEIPVQDFNPESDTMMTEQQFNENDDYLITNPSTMR